MGGVVDAVGDVFGGAADFVGDVVGGVGDFVGDVASNIDIEDAVKAYVMSGGNPYAAAFAATDFDEELGFNPASFYDPVSGGFSFAPGNTPGGGGYGGGFIKTGIDSLDQALSVAKSGYDLYNLYDQKQQPAQQPIPSLSYQQTSSGTQVDPNAFGQGLQYSFIAGLPELGDITDIITKSVSGLGNILMNAFGSDNLSQVIKKYGPAVLSVIGGKLSYDDQKRINDIVMGVYNKYNVGTELKKLQYRTGEGLASLPVFRSTRQLGSQTTATAPQRTAADVVVRPKAQMGGIMEMQPLSPMQPAMQSAMYTPLENNYFNGKPMMADGGSPEEEMELKNEFNYNRRRNEMEDLLDEYQRFKMRKDYQKRYPRDEARNGGRMEYADGTPASGLAIRLNRPIQSGDPLGSYYDDGKGPLTPGFLNDSYGPVNSLTGLRPVERKMGLFTNPDGSYPGENMFQQTQRQPRAVSANPVNDLYKYYLENETDEDYKRRIMESVKPRFGVAMGGEIPVRQNQSGVSELDLRAKGGYIPVGIKEKADDVPAMLSKNEFVFTADAVRGAGGGDINKGAQKMYKLMKSLEKKIKKTKVA